jgi:hypothetical protein
MSTAVRVEVCVAAKTADVFIVTADGLTVRAPTGAEITSFPDDGSERDVGEGVRIVRLRVPVDPRGSEPAITGASQAFYEANMHALPGTRRARLYSAIGLLSVALAQERVPLAQERVPLAKERPSTTGGRGSRHRRRSHLRLVK